MHGTKAQAMQRSFSLSLSLLSLLSLFLSFHLFSSSDKRWLRKILSKAMNWSLPKNKNFPAILNAHDTHTDSVGFLLFFFKICLLHYLVHPTFWGKRLPCWRNLPLKCLNFVFLVVLLFCPSRLGMGGCHRF